MSKEKVTPQIAAIIPARYAASRFPGKPLVKIAGVPMIERVYRQTKKCQLISRVIVATDDVRIEQAVSAFGGEVVMTGDNHASGTDRLAEVAEKHPEIDIIVNVQGDEPLVDPEAIDAAVKPLLDDRSVQMSTCAWHIKDEKELGPTVVKVVLDRNNFALYFSRHPIPFHRNPTAFKDTNYFGHMGLYVYTRQCLLKIASLAPTPLEQTECLEQLRALENGIKIKVVPFDTRSLAVDIPEDIEKVEKALQLLPI